MSHWMHMHLSFLAILATLCSVTGSQADTLEGRVLDIPLPYPDGSIRFHVLPDGRAVTSARVEGLAAGPVTLETEIAGPDLKMVFRDNQGATWRAACRLGTLVQPGAVGI